MQQDEKFDVFLSHNLHDKPIVRDLAKRLREDGLKVWFDEWVIRFGDSIPIKIDAGLQHSTVLILCMSAQAFASDWVQLESQTVLFRDPTNKKRRLIPLLLDDAPIPGMRAQFKYVDWRADPEQAYHDLLAVCNEARAALAESTQTPTAPPALPQPPSSPPPSIKTDIDRITKYAPEHLLGREPELALLEAAWQQAINPAPDNKSRAHIISFVALGGEGKTSLVAHWVVQLAAQQWPGCDAAFAWSFYSQGSDQQMAASSDLFIDTALKFFGETAMAESNQSGVDKARYLAQVVAARRVLLILDGLEPLQYAPTSVMRGALKDNALAQLLRSLASQSRGLCVLTTRYSIPDLKAYWHTTAPEHKLLRLSEPAGVALLGKLAVWGAHSECAALVQTVQGHALSIHLFGAYLRDAHAGDIRKRDLVQLRKADAQEQGGHAWRVMDAYAQWLAADGGEDGGLAGRRALALLKLLGLFDRPASGECIGALLQAPAIAGLTDDLQGLDEAARNFCYTRLQDAGLLTVQRDGGGGLQALDAHPLLRAYFAQALEQQQLAAWQAAHQRLYTYLCEHTQDKPAPTLDDLQPLYQAVAHGCLAGMQQQARDDVYNARIVRGDEYYSTQKLGAFGADLGAVACFFTQPWQHVCPALSESVQAWLLAVAAFNLRALGRLSEAAEPMRAGLAMSAERENWGNAARGAGNLSELGLTRGDLAGAVQAAEQAVSYADRSGDVFERMSNRAIHADELHQAGQPLAATALFCEAEAMQAEMQPHNPLLYSLPGFRYCDLLLAAPELAAWQGSCQGRATPSRLAAALPASNAPTHPPRTTPPNNAQGAANGQIASCHAVAQRAAQTLKIAERNNWLLTIALDHLTLARAALFTAILNNAPSAPCQAELQLAVDGLRRAGQNQYLPHALLTRAWHLAHTQHHTGPASAQTDLDEAWEIAERGPMPLFLADIHLYRAGLFHHITPYPWQSAVFDVTEARRLIKKHGYLRRMAFVEAVEQVLGIPAA